MGDNPNGLLQNMEQMHLTMIGSNTRALKPLYLDFLNNTYYFITLLVVY